ncbi:hypothetical protein MKK65_10635 [Methylobacterium sp. J-001]|uniref:hypothetical protein n=1 Tax=Methylobacterium sp. J-001 TaxID=2836609 RepID=UPI001FBBA371|nr:hypothetical protein [Methylobacterium sp. J-001]MCJ2117020.1 hypothetical protein [Methylobacterium sp. J-001]
MEPLAKLWTWAGHAFVPLAIGWAFYVRGGLDTAPPPLGALVSRGYWGLLLSLVVASLMIWVCALYVRAARAEGHAVTPPPNTTFETANGRSMLMTWGSTIVFALTILGAIAVFGVRYGDSRIHAWDARKPLADGFLSSRLEAHRHGCAHQPCYAVASRMDDAGKPLGGVVEYILYVSDGMLLAATLPAAAGVIYLLFVTSRKRPLLLAP